MKYWVITAEDGTRPQINRPDGVYAVVSFTKLEAVCMAGSGMTIKQFSHDAFVRMCNDPTQPFVGIYITEDNKYERLKGKPQGSSEGKQ